MLRAYTTCRIIARYPALSTYSFFITLASVIGPFSLTYFFMPLGHHSRFLWDFSRNPSSS